MKQIAFVLALAFPLSAFAQHPLDAPWQQADIGAVGVAGSASQSSDGDLLINGAGSDIWGTADSFHFVYQPILDGDIFAAEPSQDATNPYAKVGVMFRANLDPGSPHVVLDVKPNGEIEFMTRSSQYGQTTWIAGSTTRGSLWLIRSYGTVTGRVCPFNNDPCQNLGTVPFPTGGAYVGAIATSHDPTVLNHGMFPGRPPAVNHLPGDWISRDVGDVGLAGSASFQSGTFTIQGAGADIWGTSDSYRLTNDTMRGNGHIAAHVSSQSASNSFAKAGVIATFTPGTGPTVILDIRPNGQIEFMARTTQGGAMQFIAGRSDQSPIWLKIERSNDTFTGFSSHDGNYWTFIGTIDVVMPTDIAAGLAVTSHDRSSLNTVTYDRVELTNEAVLDHDIGDVGAAGWAGTTNGHMVVAGSGADIWGTADAFNYYSTDLLNDGFMRVRILSLDDTSAWAKAGLMMRASPDPGAAHVILDVKPDGGTEFMTRTGTGASTTFLAGAAPQAFPIWLELQRTGSTVTAYVGNASGVVSTIGSVNVDLPAHAMIGVAVTSHERGTLAQAEFDNLDH